MSEIKRCEICSTGEKDVMPILIYQGSPVFWRCLECETATTARFTQKEIDAAWNALQDRIAAKIESECAAALKAFVGEVLECGVTAHIGGMGFSKTGTVDRTQIKQIAAKHGVTGL